MILCIFFFWNNIPGPYFSSLSVNLNLIKDGKLTQTNKKIIEKSENSWSDRLFIDLCTVCYTFRMLTVFSFLLQYLYVGKVLLFTRNHFHISIRLRSNNNRCILKEKWKLFKNNSEEHPSYFGKQSCLRKS